MAYDIKSVQFTSARDVQINITSTNNDHILIIQKPASYEMFQPGVTSSFSGPIAQGTFTQGIGNFRIIAQESPDGIIQINYPTDVDSILLLLVIGTGYDTRIQDYSSWLSKGFQTKDPAMLAQANNIFDTLSPGFPTFYRPQSTPLTTPTGLYADNITSDSARTNWQAVENASNYKVQYKAAGDTVWTETYTD